MNEDLKTYFTELIEQWLASKASDFNDDELSEYICQTNANGWGLDTIYPIDIDLDYDLLTIGFSAELLFSGEQDEDKSPLGDQIQTTVTGTITFDLTQEKWTIEDYSFSGTELKGGIIENVDEEYEDDN